MLIFPHINKIAPIVKKNNKNCIAHPRFDEIIDFSTHSQVLNRQTKQNQPNTSLSQVRNND